MKYSEWAESFTIFAKYSQGDADVDAHDDVILAGPPRKIMTQDDVNRLIALGWEEDVHPYNDGWRHPVGFWAELGKTGSHQGPDE